jgi:copper ion binding protein
LKEKIMTELQKKIIPVKGMTCASCSARIEKVIGSQDGIQSVSVNLAAETMDVEWDAAALSIEDIADRVSGLGFELEIPGSEVTLDLAIEGMTCASCSARIEKVVGGLDGVYLTRKLSINAGYWKPLQGSDLKQNLWQWRMKIFWLSSSGRPGKNWPG